MGHFWSKLLIKFLDIVPRQFGLSDRLSFAIFNLSNFIPKIGSNFYQDKAPFHAKRSWSSKNEECYKSAFPQIHSVLEKGSMGINLAEQQVQLIAFWTHCRLRIGTRAENTLSKISHTFNQMMILHFDAVDFDAWHLKWYRREFGQMREFTRLAKIEECSRLWFRQAYENGETRALFRKMFF